MGASRFVGLLERGEQGTLMALGDSLTVGYMVQRGYLDMVEAELRGRYPACNLRVDNQGVCGNTVLDGLARVRGILLDGAPDLALLQFGLNDCFVGITPARFKEGLLTLIGRVRDKSPDTEIMLVPPPAVRFENFNEEAKPFRQVTIEASAEANVVAVPMAAAFHATNEDQPLWLSDGVHPSHGGYELMANAVIEAIFSS